MTDRTDPAAAPAPSASSLRAEVAALRQERDDARFDGANARAEVERLTRERECPKCAQEARSMAEADAWWNARPKCKCGRPTTDDGYGLRCLPCQEKIEVCKCDSKKED